MAGKRKTWREKLLGNGRDVEVVQMDERQARRWGSGTCVIATPLIIDQMMRDVPEGRVTTITSLRNKLAERYQATIACPLTTGIFAWIAANAAEEDIAAGYDDITPWWRTLKGDGELNPKYPGAYGQQKALLESEGHKVIQKGAKYIVEDYQTKLY